MPLWLTNLMLGLDTVGLVNETCKLAGIPRCTPDTIDIDDWEVWKDIRDDTTSIFQWNSDMASHLLKNLFSDKTMAKIRKEIPDVSLLQLFSFGNALIRPCGATVREEASNGKIIKTGIKELDDMLKNELGFALQQESYMKFAMQFCGFSQNEADKLRKCISSDADILMSDGSTKKIADVKVGDFVETYNEKDGYWEPKPVIGVYNNGFKNTYWLLLENKFWLRATADHPIKTIGGWKEISELDVNDYVVTGCELPERVIGIISYGEEVVYDLEIEENHNFVANGILVHNCISKKTPEMPQMLEKIEKGFHNVTQTKYMLSDEQCDKILGPIMQCINDASRYAFSKCHSIAYSFLGYACGWLRRYYPLEYVATCLNVWKDKEDKTAEMMRYAGSHGIKIRPPKFRYSRADYFMDKETNSIYKGIRSVKYMNDEIAEQLYALRDKEYDSFFDLLKDIKDKTSINSRQLNILIRLDFFSEFGNAKELGALVSWFDYFKQGEMKTIKKEKIHDDRLYKIIQMNSKETAKSFSIVNMDNILNSVESLTRGIGMADFTIREKMIDQMEYYGYIDISTGNMSMEERKKLIVMEIRASRTKKDNKIWAYFIKTQSVGSGKHGEFAILAKVFDKMELQQYDIIQAKKIHKKEYNGRITWYLDEYSILSDI